MYVTNIPSMLQNSSSPISHASLTLSWKSWKDVELEFCWELLRISFLGLGLHKRHVLSETVYFITYVFHNPNFIIQGMPSTISGIVSTQYDVTNPFKMSKTSLLSLLQPLFVRLKISIRRKSCFIGLKCCVGLNNISN